MERAEDAGVYKLTDDLAIVQTVDFFTPVVDDPYDFGRIAVANSLSDVYAMGGKPLTAMNIVCFPIKQLDVSVLHRILEGGLEKMREAGVALVGGHSVDDKEPKYGLSVTGIIHPDKVIKNTGARPGDKLILTKPLGVGIITTALKGGLAEESSVRKATECMATLNAKAAELMVKAGANACTDVTGFGLLGHASEMIVDTDVCMIIDSSKVPYIEEAKELANMGLVPGGTHRNRQFREHMVEIRGSVPRYMSDILYDPQTSGGLLIALPEEKAEGLLKEMHREGVTDAAIIGEIADCPKGNIIVR